MPALAWAAASCWPATVVILSFYGDTRSLGQDESFSVWIARPGWANIRRYIVDDPHAPLHYGLLSQWIRWGGESEPWLRALSAIIFLGGLAAVWAPGRRVFSPRQLRRIMVGLATSRALLSLPAVGRMYGFEAESAVATIAHLGPIGGRHATGPGATILLAANLAGVFTHYCDFLSIGSIGLHAVAFVSSVQSSDAETARILTDAFPAGLKEAERVAVSGAFGRFDRIQLFEARVAGGPSRAGPRRRAGRFPLPPAQARRPAVRSDPDTDRFPPRRGRPPRSRARPPTRLIAMKILFTGGSSFTGMWFIRELAAAGHEVAAVFRRRPDEYADAVRRRRVAMALEVCRPVDGCSFGDDRFLALLGEGWDLLCHHAADVTNYKSPDFDAIAALANNARNLAAVLAALKAAGGRRVLLSGSVFEGGEGAGSQGLPDFSPYGLSKALTAQVFRFECGRAGVGLGKFVIPNPIGAYEEPRFTGYLMKNWLAGATPNCSSPAYVRDNIHATLLAKAYARFAAQVPAEGFARTNPSGYAETQGAFTLRMAQEMRPRLGLPCAVELKKQVDFPEPRVRINTDPADADALGWDESAAWDGMARFYQELYGASGLA